ncbi:2,3-bisphosphoglycerate-dependent phosphoglycerate mutase, partial [Listeria monocytogenes]|nr:2,3-bisphosphoglycerate-dependent phosphoglycerate mutase [Listeria monocytogenes]
YGALQGLNKQETAEKYGADQVQKWRRSYDTLPPLLEENAERQAKNDRRYQLLDTHAIPAGETLKVTLERVIPYWMDTIAP